MGIEANKAIVRRYVELYNTGHVDLWSNQDTLGWLQQLGLELKLGIQIVFCNWSSAGLLVKYLWIDMIKGRAPNVFK